MCGGRLGCSRAERAVPAGSGRGCSGPLPAPTNALSVRLDPLLALPDSSGAPWVLWQRGAGRGHCEPLTATHHSRSRTWGGPRPAKRQQCHHPAPPAPVLQSPPLPPPPAPRPPACPQLAHRRRSRVPRPTPQQPPPQAPRRRGPHQALATPTSKPAARCEGGEGGRGDAHSEAAIRPTCIPGRGAPLPPPTHARRACLGAREAGGAASSEGVALRRPSAPSPCRVINPRPRSCCPQASSGTPVRALPACRRARPPADDPAPPPAPPPAAAPVPSPLCARPPITTTATSACW